MDIAKIAPYAFIGFFLIAALVCWMVGKVTGTQDDERGRNQLSIALCQLLNFKFKEKIMKAVAYVQAVKNLLAAIEKAGKKS